MLFRIDSSLFFFQHLYPTGECSGVFQNELLTCITASVPVTVYGDTTGMELALASAPSSHDNLGIPGIIDIASVSVEPTTSGEVTVAEGAGNPPLVSTSDVTVAAEQDPDFPSITAVRSVPEGNVSPSDGGLSSGAVAGAIIAGLVACALLIALIVRRQRRRRQRNCDPVAIDEGHDPTDDWDDGDVYGPDVQLEHHEGNLTMVRNADEGEVEIMG